MQSMRDQKFFLTKSTTTASIVRPTIACFTAFRDLSFLMVFDLFSNSVGKTNCGTVKTGVFQPLCMLANCNADCFLHYRCSSRIIRLSIASVNRQEKFASVSLSALVARGTVD